MNKYVGWHLFGYYQWLLDKINGYTEPYYNYSLLLSELHSIPFTYSIAMDGNRASDGVRLRWTFMDEENIPDLFYKDGIECSVLEMLISLSIRCDVDIMGDNDGKNVYAYFWIMIQNLGLDKCTDDHFDPNYVHQQIRKWLDRSFRRNGEGSPFPLQRCRTDQRKIEIWFQMNAYLNENFIQEDYI